MVGIVLVSHSHLLAQGLKQLTDELSQNKVQVATAGGLDDCTIGTSVERIKEAIDTVYSSEGVLLILDLGSALLSTELALEEFPPEQRSKIKLSNAPLVEGAIVATVEASLGHTLEQVNAAAEAAKDMNKIE